jgi:hypothetical protein
MTKEEKAGLKNLAEHRDFKILEKIVEEKRQMLWTTFETLSIGDVETIKKIHDSQNFLQGMKYVVEVCKGTLQEIKNKGE